MTELEKLIEMLKADRSYYQKWKNFGIANDISNAMIIYYTTILTYINSLITRIEKGSK
jgi:hypothetical protein